MLGIKPRARHTPGEGFAATPAAQLLTMDVFLVTCLCSIPFMESYVKCKNSFYCILSTRGRQTMGEVQSCFDIHHQ